MEFATSEDIEAPLNKVFFALADFEPIERQVMRRGVEVKRRDATGAPSQGMIWDADFSYRGKPRSAVITLSVFDAPELMEFTSASGGLDVVSRLECVALSRTRTRIVVNVDLRPRTLSARLLVQSMKLARGKLNRRFSKRMKEFAREFEKKLTKAA